MSVSFVTNIAWPQNPQKQNPVPFKIKVPDGVAKDHVRSPKYVDVPGMSAALKAGTTLAEGSSGQLGTVNGLVTANLELKFENPQMQWKARPTGGANAQTGPVEFTFQGGKVQLALSLAIFVLNTNKPHHGDTTSAKIFSAVYSHELLHVYDNLDMFNKWLLPKLKYEPLIDKYLVKADPYVYGRTQDPVPALTTEFHSFMRNKLETEAFNLWAVEANRRQAIRDAPAEYKKVQDKIDDLRSSYTR